MDTVKIADVRLMRDQYLLVIDGTGHATQFMEACREIAQSTIRSNFRWWFQSVEGRLDKHDAELVSDMFWHVTIEFGD